MESLFPGNYCVNTQGLDKQRTPSDPAHCLLGKIPPENNYLWIFAAVLGLASDAGLLAGQELSKWAMVAGHRVSTSRAPAEQLFFSGSKVLMCTRS